MRRAEPTSPSASAASGGPPAETGAAPSAPLAKPVPAEAGGQSDAAAASADGGAVAPAAVGAVRCAACSKVVG
jgi:hypothetical protein